MKRLTAAILALVITLTLCACGATGNTGAASAGNKPKKIEKPVADTLDGILEAIDDYKTTVQAFRDSLDTINAVIGGDYKNYVKNRQMIDDWYTQVETETAQLFQRTEENCKQYFILMSTQTEHTYKAMNREADKVYDSVYDDVRDDFYDDIYDDLMDDLYDEYYDAFWRMLMTLFRTKSTVNRDLTSIRHGPALTPKFTVCCRNMAAGSMGCARPSVRLFIKMTMILPQF